MLELPAIKKRGWAFVVQGDSQSDVSGPAALPQQLEISYQHYDLLVPLTATSSATSSPHPHILSASFHQETLFFTSSECFTSGLMNQADYSTPNTA